MLTFGGWGTRLSPQSLACCRCSPMWYLAMWATRAPSFHCSSLALMQISSTPSNFPITQALPSSFALLLFSARRNSPIINNWSGPGYPTWQGEKLTGEQLGKLVQGLKANNLICYSHLLTGEPPLFSSLLSRSPSHLIILNLHLLHLQATWAIHPSWGQRFNSLKPLKKQTLGSYTVRWPPFLFFAKHLKTLTVDMATLSLFLAVCDPVMGDNGKLYVPQELVDIYASEVIPHADIITPNQYECQYVLAHVDLSALSLSLSLTHT